MILVGHFIVGHFTSCVKFMDSMSCNKDFELWHNLSKSKLKSPSMTVSLFSLNDLSRLSETLFSHSTLDDGGL